GGFFEPNSDLLQVLCGLRPWATGLWVQRLPLGRCATFEQEPVELLLTTKRHQQLNTDHLTSVGGRPNAMRDGMY
ncbi:MAG TPA: hypothetical protein VJO72_13080, partial [Candidatus Dormibacteraeota bacterium]|nr:hypothetical protein [Candidatus Dormibacteraeota bacterium]